MKKPPRRRPYFATPEERRTYYKWWREKQGKKLVEYQHAYRLANPLRALLHSAKHRAKKRGLPFSITIDDVVMPTHCPVFGMPLVVAVGRKAFRDDSPTLDRIDNEAGYIPGNVIVVSWKANRIKNDATIDDLARIVDFYKDKSW